MIPFGWTRIRLVGGSILAVFPPSFYLSPEAFKLTAQAHNYAWREPYVRNGRVTEEDLATLR